jgi:alkylated DNA nucleotide flippase Atl1
MMARRKTWHEKLADKDGYPKVLQLEKKFPCYNAVHKMGAEVGDDIVLVNPSEVVEFMQKVPFGKVTTIIEICKGLARKHHVRGCCSLTTGIFIMTAANAVEEARSGSQDLDIPYWRTLKAGGFLNEKFPGGAEAHKALLEEEGFQVISKGKRFLVQDYQDHLMESFGHH